MPATSGNAGLHGFLFEVGTRLAGDANERLPRTVSLTIHVRSFIHAKKVRKEYERVVRSELIGIGIGVGGEFGIGGIAEARLAAARPSRCLPSGSYPDTQRVCGRVGRSVLLVEIRELVAPGGMSNTMAQELE